MSFIRERISYPIHIYIQELRNDKYTFPKWQREDCWKQTYKEQLILSILKGIDLPKIYLGEIKDTDNVYIIDGGHRSRAIDEFMRNEFSITLNSMNIYYNKKFEKDTRNKGILTNQQKKSIDKYHLDVVTYTEITENDCRDIFNKLQNSKPMSIEDVINSWQSPLVDYIRDILDYVINGNKLYNHFVSLKINRPVKTLVMSQLLGWYTILFPNMELHPGEEYEIVSLKYLTKGNNNNSPCLEYIRTYNKEITADIKSKFIELIHYILDYYENKKITTSDMNTLIHSKYNFDDFNLDKYHSFLDNVKIYDSLKKLGNELQEKKDYEGSKSKFIEAENLNSSYSNKLEIWYKSRKDGGNNPKGMKKRMEIVKDYCLD